MPFPLAGPTAPNKPAQGNALENRSAPHPGRTQTHPPPIPPQSAFGKAITYTLDLWPALEICVTDGRIEIDNNGAENAIRPPAIGKKNWLFIGAAHVGERGAILYPIVESCRRRGIDPLAYRRDMLSRLPKMTMSEIPEVTPEARTKAQPAPRPSLFGRAGGRPDHARRGRTLPHVYQPGRVSLEFA